MPVRNCKAGKCGSCSAEVNGKPRLMCMTRLNELDLSQPVTVEPMKSFLHMKDLVTDVSWNFEVKKRIKSSSRASPMRRMEHGGCSRRMWTAQEFRKCIECFLCQDVCHVLRDHHKHPEFAGRGTLCTRRRWRCTRSTLRTGWGS